MILDNFAATDEAAIVTGAGQGIGRSIASGTGAIGTRCLATVMQDGQMHSDLLERTPMQRAGMPEDIACAALYAKSPASSWVTGAILKVDGGSGVPAIEIPTPPLEP